MKTTRRDVLAATLAPPALAALSAVIGTGVERSEVKDEFGNKFLWEKRTGTPLWVCAVTDTITWYYNEDTDQKLRVKYPGPPEIWDGMQS